jgi:Protein of unknown function (DUF3309)
LPKARGALSKQLNYLIIYSADWGYYPSSGLGLILIIVLLLVLLGRI